MELKNSLGYKESMGQPATLPSNTKAGIGYYGGFLWNIRPFQEEGYTLCR